MVPFQSKKSKFLNRNGAISEKGQRASTKMEPFRKRVKNRQQKWYHFSQKRVKFPQQKWFYFRKGSKIINKNGTISEKGQKSTTKMVPFQKRVKNRQQIRKSSKILDKNGTISEKGQKSSTKMVPFQKRVEIIDKNGTISGKGQKSSTKMVAF